MASPWFVIKDNGPKLVPFFKSVVLFFIVYPTKSAPTFVCLIMKCVPIAALCLFVIMHGLNLKFECSYSRRIFVGLLFSMIGDACLVYKEQYFVPGLLSFAVAHVIYFTAFGIKPFNIRLALALMALCVPISAIYIPHITNYVLKVLVPAYTLLILSMLWRAISRLSIFNKEVEWTWTKLCCTLGAFCFVVSDSILSFDLFIHKVPYSHPLIMLTYYMAQMGIALSVVDSHKSSEINHLVIQHNHLIDGLKSVYYQLKATILEYTSSEEILFVGENNASKATSASAERIDHLVTKVD